MHRESNKNVPKESINIQFLYSRIYLKGFMHDMKKVYYKHKKLVRTKNALTKPPIQIFPCL